MKVSNWHALCRLAGGSVESAMRQGISCGTSFNLALLSGRILQIKGIGKRAYLLLCELQGWEILPEWDEKGKLVRLPKIRKQ